MNGDNSVKNCVLFVFLFFRKHYFASFKHKNFCAFFEAYEPVSTHEEEKMYISLACSVSQQRVPKHLSRDVEKYCFDVCLKKRKTFCFHFRQEYRTSCQDLAFRRQDKFTERSSKALEKFGIRFQKIENALKRSLDCNKSNRKIKYLTSMIFSVMTGLTVRLQKQFRRALLLWTSSTHSLWR